MIGTILLIVMAMLAAISLAVAGYVAFLWRKRARWWFAAPGLCLASAIAAMVWR